MGNLMSIAKSGEDLVSAGQSKGIAEDTDSQHIPNLPNIDETRLVELLQALKQLSRLQQDASDAQIDTRQKMREVGLNRKAVWTSDAAFMKEVQLRMAASQLDRTDDLVMLAARCQAARDGLGPLEQEGIEVEQRWEGSLWKLRQAEVKLFQDFNYEFQFAESYSSSASSNTSSRYEASLTSEDHYLRQSTDQPTSPFSNPPDSVTSTSSFNVTYPETQAQSGNDTSQENTLLGLKETVEAHSEVQDELSWDSDSGIGDIDHMPSPEEQVGSPQKLPQGHTGSFERYPHLLTDFGSRRDRINKWLEHSTLVSRIEATLLKNQLDLENPRKPSNWSQLVIAYWELDAASSRPTLQYGNHLDFTLGNENVENMEPPTESWNEASPPTPGDNPRLKPLSLLTANTDLKLQGRDKLYNSTVSPSTVQQHPRIRSKSDTGRNSIRMTPEFHVFTGSDTTT